MGPIIAYLERGHLLDKVCFESFAEMSGKETGRICYDQDT